jgi:hypothetical protein
VTGSAGSAVGITNAGLVTLIGTPESVRMDWHLLALEHPIEPRPLEPYGFNLLSQVQMLEGHAGREPAHARVPTDSKLVTRFVAVFARLAATGATHCDECIRLYLIVQCFLLYPGGTGSTHCDSGTFLRIRRLGVRIPPSALA